MRLARFHAFSRSPERDAWSKLRAWADPRGLLREPATHPVLGFNNPSPTSGGAEYGYEFWIGLALETPAESGIGTVDFPGGWYAVTTHRGPPNPTIWMQLWEWVHRSPYRYRRTHELERLHDPLASEPEMVCDLYLPIEEPATGSAGTPP